MAKLFEIPDEVRQIAQDGLDDLITQIGKQCQLIYPARMVPGNPPDQTIGQKGGNQWVTGGPMNRATPSQGGTGYVAEQESETIQMLIQWNPSDFFIKPPYNVQIPDGTIQTKGFQADLPKVLRAAYMIVSPDKEGLIRWKYELDGEPGDKSNLVPGVFFVAQWKRVG